MAGPEIFHITDDSEPIGDGREQLVFQDPLDESRVIAVNKSEEKISPNIIKGRFYLSKILHLLFPNNLPDVRVASSEPEVTVRQDLKLEEPYTEMQRMFINKVHYGEEIDRERFKKLLEEQRGKFKREEVQTLINQLKALGVDVQENAMDFVDGKDGNVKYVEVADAFNSRGRLYNPETIREAIDALSEEEKRRARSYLERLEALYEEEVSKGE